MVFWNTAPTDGGFQVWFALKLAKLFNPLKKDGSVNKRLMDMVATKVGPSNDPIGGVRSLDFTIDTTTGLWCRVFVPVLATPGKKLPVIVYYHGGGFVLYNPDSKEFDSFGCRLSKACEVVVISCSYRLAPEHKYPTQYEDGFAAVKWIRSQNDKPHKDFPIDVMDFSHFFFSGDSAGGNIAHHVAVKAVLADISPISLVGMILVEPFFGSEERTSSDIMFEDGDMLSRDTADWFWRAFLPLNSDRDHPAANVSGPRAPALSSLNLPRTLVVRGGKDLLQDVQSKYVAALQEGGIECKDVFYETAFHAFYLFPNLKSSIQFEKDVKEFVNSSMGDSIDTAATEGATDFDAGKV